MASVFVRLNVISHCLAQADKGTRGDCNMKDHLVVVFGMMAFFNR